MTTSRTLRSTSLLGLVLLLALGGLSCGKKKLTSKNIPDPNGAVRLALLTNPPDLDPILISDTTSSGIVSKIFDTLLTHDDELNVIPGLAKELPTVSDDRLVYTFKLREGVKFHNGREVKAQDFKYSLERLAQVNSKRNNVVKPILGAEEAIERAQTGGDTVMEGIKVLDDYTLEITLAKPYYPFLFLMTMDNAAVVPREEVEKAGDGFSRRPVGSGPFKLDVWKENDMLRLVANEDYWAGKPKIPEITMRIIPESLTRTAEYKAGKLDIVDVTQGMLPRWQASDHADDVLLYDQSAILYYGFNLQKEGSPFAGYGDKARKLREAVNWAVDRQFICERILDGKHSPINGILPPGMPGANKTRPVFTQDLEKAKKLLEEAGHPMGEGLEPVELWFNSQGDNAKIAQAVQNDLGLVGIEISLKQLDWAAFLKATEAGEPAFFRLGWSSSYADPEYYLYFLFHSSNHGPNGNNTFYSNPEVDRLIDESYGVADAEERLDLLRRAEELIVADYPWLFLTSAREALLVKPYLKGYNPTALDDDSAGGSQVNWAEIEIVPATTKE